MIARLLSSRFVSAPGMLRWAINGCAFEDDRPTVIRVIRDTWRLKPEVAEGLCLGTIPFTVDEHDNAVIDYDGEISEAV